MKNIQILSSLFFLGCLGFFQSYCMDDGKVPKKSTPIPITVSHKGRQNKPPRPKFSNEFEKNKATFKTTSQAVIDLIRIPTHYHYIIEQLKKKCEDPTFKIDTKIALPFLQKFKLIDEDGNIAKKDEKALLAYFDSKEYYNQWIRKGKTTLNHDVHSKSPEKEDEWIKSLKNGGRSPHDDWDFYEDKKMTVKEKPEENPK